MIIRAGARRESIVSAPAVSGMGMCSFDRLPAQIAVAMESRLIVLPFVIPGVESAWGSTRI